ncbi:hypothetical protein FSP39_011406 [Pinctada imbricata]|uniref:YqaJ viral recombinase domain-containing protein n=1 Tax=Pinctada imbricata TaxID=66713 RepID=A0AA88Y7G1_PINIB|nr:hypothetical protein FSP39_011406 [Pinctada imbricata]
MGSKRKSSTVFGRGSGIHRKKRIQKFAKTLKKNEKYKVTLSDTCTKIHLKRMKPRTPVLKTKKKLLGFRAKKPQYISFLEESGCNLKLKIKRVINSAIGGYRLINLENLQHHVTDITMHACVCPQAIKLASVGKPPIKLDTEIRSLGLASVMAAKCHGCGMEFHFSTSPQLPGTKRYDINVRAVWGSMSTGNGPSHLNELLGTLNSPGLSQPSFSAIESDIGKWWLSILERDMLAAGAEERELAISRGDFHHEVPAITVITDGGWSKRTHKHSYNAMGGVAIIIGYETKKLLHIGVRNKYCYVCSTCPSDQKVKHDCYKNWTRDSQSMEREIILEGFLQCESKHGVRYMRIVADGDSSVFARIKEEVPIWGKYVIKKECANHACKCFRSNLEKLVADNPLYKGKHHLSKSTRVRLVSAVRCAIRVRSKELESKQKDRSTAIKDLSHDIRNSVYHVFGKHDNCSDFCRASEKSKSDNFKYNVDNDDSSIVDVLDEQVNQWTEGCSLESQEDARCGTAINYSDVEHHIIKDVSFILNRISEKADRLIGNNTTNLAEAWMHIRSKFDGGKVLNLCNKGSWHARCYGGALRMNLGPQWAPHTWKIATATEPGYHFEQLYARREVLVTNTRKHQAKPSTQSKRWKKKVTTLKTSNTRKARRAYGPEAVDVTSDVSVSELQSLKSSFLEKNINLTDSQITSIQSATLKQSQSGLWHSERKKRITASNFGPVVRRNPSLPVKKLVRNLLYSNFQGNRHTRNGLLQEQTTVEEYVMRKAEQRENVTVKTTGLVISKTDKFLAGSPDGIVQNSSGEEGLIEIKNLLHSKPINLWQAAKNKNFCLEIQNDSLQLKKNHNYYYQCHGLMNICDCDWIDFIVRTLNPYQMFVQRIHRDKQLWENIMLPKLKAFYHSSLLPELACPRDGKSPGIREPGIWVSSVTMTKMHSLSHLDVAINLVSI